MNRKLICQILNHEMMLATGCTEPAAIALTAAIAREQLDGELEHIKVRASANIIKNAMSAGIPGTNYTGINYAAALGAVCGAVDRQLRVVDDARPEDIERAAHLVENGYVDVRRAFDPDKLYVEVELVNKEHQSRAIIKGAHTNVILVERDHQRVGCELPGQTMETDITPEQISRTLNIRTIYEFVETMDRRQDDLHMIQEAIEVNGHIAQLGAAGDYGLNIGHGIRNNQEAGLMGHDVVMDAVAMTASGVDARMAGANAPVITNSGSGNQGITATMPVVSAAKTLGIDEDKMFRAVTLAHLMGIHIHCRFGLLSGLCGATVAGTGSACGLVYLLGGNVKQIGYAVNNMLGDVTGMLCDGAKADCALKISTCVNTAFQCAFMALDNVCVQPSDGIVDSDPEQTIKNFVRLGNEGSPVMDNIVLDVMLTKHK